MNQPLLELKQVSRHYWLGSEQVNGLKPTSIEIEQGAFTALTGPSGSGKSTLLNLCGLIDRADSGEIRLQGEAVTDLDEVALTQIRRQQIGFIFQSFNLVPVMSVYENVEYPLLLERGARSAHQAVSEILQHVGLAPFAHHLPDQISGGQRQRVSIARALVKQPTLVIADEPTANLDGETATQVIDLMHRIGREWGSTFLIATHDPRVAQRCDQQIQLVDGEVI